MRISDWCSDVFSSDLFSGTDEPLGVDDGGTVKAQFVDGIERGFEDNRAASRGAHLFAVLFAQTVERHQPVSGDRLRPSWLGAASNIFNAIGTGEFAANEPGLCLIPPIFSDRKSTHINSRP